MIVFSINFITKISNLQNSGILILNNGPLENVKNIKHYHYIKQGQNITSI